MTISYSIAAALCVLGSLTGAAHGSNINGEASYISFTVPDSRGTYPMAINSSMIVTGYYLVTNSEARAFIRTAEGTIDTFGVGGAVWTEPASINAAGDITGFYYSTSNRMQGFLRYADGRILTFDPPPQGGDAPTGFPVGINDFDDIVGTVYNTNANYSGFTRSREGVYTQISFGGETVATAINANGSVVGWAVSFAAGPPFIGFETHPDGYRFTFTASLPSSAACITAGTFPGTINAAGTIAGWYYALCPAYERGGFVRSPEGVVTFFPLPGPIGQNYIAINEVGDVTGAYTDTTGDQHGFVRNPYGTITTFDPPEHDAVGGTQPTSVNDVGVITGFYNGSGVTGFLRVPSTGTSTGQ